MTRDDRDVTLGDSFALVSDRDPSPVRADLADLAGVAPDDVDPFDVRRTTPEAWVLRTERRRRDGANAPRRSDPLVVPKFIILVPPYADA